MSVETIEWCLVIALIGFMVWAVWYCMGYPKKCQYCGRDIRWSERKDVSGLANIMRHKMCADRYRAEIDIKIRKRS